MTIEQIKDLIECDSAIDSSKLDLEAINTPYIQGKYIRLLSNETAVYKNLKTQLDRLKHNKYNLFMGRLSQKEQMESKLGNLKLLKTEIPQYIENDDDVIALKALLIEAELKVDLITQFITVLNQRTFQIKNAIEYMRFQNGLN